MASEFQFHRDMIEVFTSVRDLHTNYMLPAPFADKVAFLPFDIEEYFEGANPRYIATHFVQGFSHAHFKQGVEITAWNGVPIRRAVEVSADQHAGSNAAARHARGVDGLTVRALRRALPPDAMWVIIGYTDLNGVEREIRQDWLVSPMLPDTGGVDADSANANAACLGIDIEADIKQRARKMLFAPGVIAEEKASKEGFEPQRRRRSVAGDDPGRRLQRKKRHHVVRRVRLYSGSSPSMWKTRKDSSTNSSGWPNCCLSRGWIVDVRGNGGGHIFASEGLLQVLTPVEVHARADPIHQHASECPDLHPA